MRAWLALGGHSRCPSLSPASHTGSALGSLPFSIRTYALGHFSHHLHSLMTPHKPPPQPVPLPPSPDLETSLPTWHLHLDTPRHRQLGSWTSGTASSLCLKPAAPGNLLAPSLASFRSWLKWPVPLHALPPPPFQNCKWLFSVLLIHLPDSLFSTALIYCGYCHPSLMGWNAHEGEDVSVLLLSASPASRPAPGTEQAHTKYTPSELMYFTSC